MPNEIPFYDERGNQMQMTSCNDFLPIICQHGNHRKSLHLKNESEEQRFANYMEDNEVLARHSRLFSTRKDNKRFCSDVCSDFANCSIKDPYSEIVIHQNIPNYRDLMSH